jgi:hypothetical protein
LGGFTITDIKMSSQVGIFSLPSQPTTREEAAMKTNDSAKKHQGSCHCGAVRFEVTLDAIKGARCNCTICNKLGTTNDSVKPEAFTLLSGEAHLSSYEWGTKVGKRFFCRVCGVSCFGRGHLAEYGGDFVSISYNCLDDVDLAEVEVLYWDGRHDNWEAGPRSTPWPIFTKS